MSGQGWVCRDEHQLTMCFDHLRKNWDWKKQLSIEWHDGIKKSMGQLALVHVWIRLITQHMNKLQGNDYDDETVKTYLKRRFGTRIESKDLVTGEPMPALKSYARYEKGEMAQHMNQIAVFASEIGCTLPVYGEYETLRHAA